VIQTIILVLCLFFGVTNKAATFSPGNWPEENRLEKAWLGSIDIQHGHITAHHGYGINGNQTSINSIFTLPLIIEKISGYDCFIRAYQNFIQGFFITSSVEYQSINGSNQTTEIHLKKLTNFILQAGWTHSDKTTEELDFIDYTIKIGFYNPDPYIAINEFQWIYQKTRGCVIDGQIGIGLFEWLTIGLNGECIVNSQAIDEKKNPIATIINGNIVSMDLYIKADHVIKGFSCGIGYSFFHEFYKKIATITSTNKTSQHIFHLILEYDFTKYNSTFGPRIGFTYNTTIGGSNCLKSSLLQGIFGLEIAFQH